MFSNKFRLLNSQENNDKINWILSDSSDYENVNNDNVVTNKMQSRKRKRKKNQLKNISNLNVTITDVRKNINISSCRAEISPVLQRKFNHKIDRLESLPTNFLPCKSNEPSISPILCPKNCNQSFNYEAFNKSPILVPKCNSPNTANVKKKLFSANQPHSNQRIRQHSKSPLLANNNKNINSLDIRRNCDQGSITYNSKNILIDNSEYEKLEHLKTASKNVKNYSGRNNSDHDKSNSETKEKDSDDSFLSTKTADFNLVNKVKSYFENQFSSENASQNSITDISTPKESMVTKSNEDIEIISSATPATSNNSIQSIKQELKSKNVSPTDSYETNINVENIKKIRYRKNGLAYRLNALLKKQNAQISLWHHERFLAKNSNFLIPKEKYRTFRIQKVQLKYSCYLLEAIDSNDEEFLIQINSSYLNNTILVENVILKLYEPYKILDYNGKCKLIINVCKFECKPII